MIGVCQIELQFVLLFMLSYTRVCVHSISRAKYKINNKYKTKIKFAYY